MSRFSSTLAGLYDWLLLCACYIGSLSVYFAIVLFTTIQEVAVCTERFNTDAAIDQACWEKKKSIVFKWNCPAKYKRPFIYALCFVFTSTSFVFEIHQIVKKNICKLGPFVDNKLITLSIKHNLVYWFVSVSRVGYAWLFIASFRGAYDLWH